MEWSKGRVYLGGGVLVRGGRLSVVLCENYIGRKSGEEFIEGGIYPQSLCCLWE